jgi:N-formylglutamate deformylase
MTALDPALISLKKPPRQTLPLVVAVPHAGRDYGPSFTEGLALTESRRRLIEDAYIDDLAGLAPELGIPLLTARFPRIWLDVNRDARELDPLLIEGDLPPGSLTASGNVRSGLGVVPRLVTGGEAILKKPLSFREVETRLAKAWHPYHATLEAMIQETVEHFGHCLLIDCHSMPSGRELDAPDIVLGDGFGATADGALVDAAENFFTAQGFNVARNRPYAGGFTTRHYGQPSQNRHALQIEIRRSLYMNETTFERLSGFETFAEQMGALFSRLGDIVQTLKT